MIARPATRADIPALTALERKWDEAWFGSPEHDEAEVAEAFALLADPERDSRLLFDDAGPLLAHAMRLRTEAYVIVQPDVEAGPVYADLLAWLAAAGATHLQCLDRDEVLRTALLSRGWSLQLSAFDLRRGIEDLPAPRWADGVTLRDFVPGDAAAVHELVYVHAAFADVPGHHPRELDEWRQIFLDGRTPAEAPVLACRDGRLVGASIGRLHSDGTGWINQLAVARDTRGRGVGRALILETFARRVAAGATSLGLGVLAENRDALALYLDLGLRIEREWQAWNPPA